MRHIATTLLATLHVATASQCMLDYQEYSKKDNCLAGIAQKESNRYFGHLIQGGDNLKDTTCFVKGPDSIQTSCASDPNKLATINIFSGDTTCDAGTTPTAVELKIDGVCNEVQVPDGAGGQKALYYKANPVPPDPRCMAKYEEFANEQDCLDGNAIADDDAKLTFPSYVGAANEANLVHNTCATKDADSRIIQCNKDSFQPDKWAKILSYTGDDKCSLPSGDENLKTTIIEVDAQCKQQTATDGSTTFWYKASPAQCFKWYVEFNSEDDCSNNQNPVTGAAQNFPFLIGQENEINSYDKMCNVHKAKSYRVTCNTMDNGAFEETEPDKEFIVETYWQSDCNLKNKKPYETTKLTVDNQCNNYVFNDKTIWYKAVQTTDTTENRPGEDQLSSGAKCTDNKIEGDDDEKNNGKRCVQWNAKPVKCNSMGFPGEFEMGLYKKRARLASDDAPKSNLCKTTCIDNGDIFCVNKNDLKSNPVCCPKDCADPDNDNKNACSNTLTALGNHVCSDEFSTARDEFKYLLCPREEMESHCGEDKLIKFDLEKDKLQETKTFNVPWYKPYSLMYPLSDSPTYKFEKQGVCNYVFMMPDNAGTSSSMTITFKGSEVQNKNVQAYYATYRSSTDDDDSTSIGQIMTKYDGQWNRQYPTDPPTDDEKKAEYDYVQSREIPASDEKKRFLEQNQLIDLLGQGDDSSPKQIKLQLSSDPDKNSTVAFVTITSQFTAGTSGDDVNKKVYTKKGGAFEFEVKTNFRKMEGAENQEESEAVKVYEKEEEEKREQALLIVLFGLAGVVGLVILIFIYQAICSKHTNQEVQKRTLNYKKEDMIIRHTLKVRKSTMAANVGRIRKGTIQSDYKSVADQEGPGSDRQIQEVAADMEHDGEVDKKEPVNATNVSMRNLDVSERVDFEKNEQILNRNVAQK